MDHGIVIVPAAPIRRKPGHQKEMTNQLLFGENVQVLRKKKNGWTKIRSLHDDYEGWTSQSMILEVDARDMDTGKGFVTTDMFSPVIIGERPLHIPVGSSLPFFKNGNGSLGPMEYSYAGHYFKREDQRPSGELVQQLAFPWLNAPYLWGGRSPLGVDCSGYVQVVFKLMGIDLPRDAWQQAQEGEAVKKFRDIQIGDLAFFDNKEDIVHTGILVGDDRIIHASGKVRIDTIDKKGIINTETGKRMQGLRAIRRFF